jgi:citrate lyase subunit beta/citryl-CoA lyase
MIETPRGVENANELAAFENVEVLVLGTTDLAYELRLPNRPDRIGLQYALSRCVMAARLAGVSILDGVYLGIRDEEGFNAVCEQGLALGFDGKTLIHPSQIEGANRVFGIAAERVEYCERLLQAWDEAAAVGKGVAVLDGKLVEVMHVDEARRILAMAENIASLEAAGG